MYQALITRRYLFSKIMPLLSVLAVMLCTAMVLVVWSVMGGFLNLLLASGKSMIGDVSIAWPVVGISHYEELIDRLEADPSIDAATPMIETPGMLSLPGGDVRLVQVMGVEPAGYDAVTGYYERLWWRYLAEPLPKDEERRDPRLDEPRLDEVLEHGRVLREPDIATGLDRDAIALGIEVTRSNARTSGGIVVPQFFFGPAEEVTLQVMPLSRRGVPVTGAGPASAQLPIANEFRTGLYEADANWVVVPIGLLQRLLLMDEAERVGGGGPRLEIDEDGNESWVVPEVIGVEPSRVTTILIKASEGVSADDCEVATRAVYEQLHADLATRDRYIPDPARISIYTWERKPGLEMFIAAVKKETALVLVLFGFISLTAVFLVFAIFWSMISEKTKDIGVLRAIGASRAGIAWLFLRYGMVIGITGSLAGGAVAWLIVANINPIHEWLGRALGLVIWDPSVYYFSEIPSELEAGKATIVLSLGVLASVLGALVPALRAAWMDPVKALRFE